MTANHAPEIRPRPNKPRKNNAIINGVRMTVKKKILRTHVQCRKSEDLFFLSIRMSFFSSDTFRSVGCIPAPT